MQPSDVVMLVNVLYFGHLREVTLKDKETIEMPSGATVGTLIEFLEGKYGPEYRTAMDAIKGLRILVDGRDHTLLGGKEAPLNEGARLCFCHPLPVAKGLLAENR